MKNNKLLSGLKWSIFSTGGRQLFQTFFTILLARVLSPEDFGLVSMITVFTGFSFVIMNFGFGTALIQKSDATQLDFSSVFWINGFIGAILSLIIYFLSSWIAEFYQNAQLSDLTKLISFNYFVLSLGLTHKIKLQKELLFKEIAKVEIIAMLIAGIIACTLAYGGYGVYSLIIQTIVLAFLQTGLYWIVSKWRPILRFSKASIKSIFNFSINLFGNQTLGYITSNLDYLLIGKYLGDGSLGIYRNSFSLIIKPLNALNGTLFNVFFPHFSSFKKNLEAVGDNYFKAISVLFYVTAPVMLIAFFLSEFIVLTLFGNEWEAMIPLIRLMAFPGLLFSLTSFNGSIFLAFGKSNTLLKVNLFNRVIVSVGIILGLYWGIKGVAFSFNITYLVSFFFSLYFVLKELKTNLSAYLNMLKNSLLSLIAPVFIGSFIIFNPYNLWVSLFGLLAMIVAFLLCSYLFQPYPFVFAKNYFHRKVKTI